jgi:hypothetical protein
MTSEKSIIDLIKKTKWKSFEKLHSIIKQKYVYIESKQLLEIRASNYTRDIKTLIKHNSKFYNKIYSSHRESYKMNILINSSDDYLISININISYQILESIPNESITSILSVLNLSSRN